MENKIKQKFIASAMLLTFTLANSPLAFAVNSDYYRPLIRSNQGLTTLDVGTNVKIKNADSIVNLSLRDADVTQVLRMFADQAGMNIIFSPSVKGTITMDLVNITLEKALNMVVSMAKLAYDIQSNTMIVTTSGEEKISTQSKSMVLIPVKYIGAGAIADYLNKNVFGSKSGIAPGVSNKPVVTVNPALNELIVTGTETDVALVRKILEQFDKKPTITTFKVNHVTPAEMSNMICSTLLPTVMSKGGSSSGTTGKSTGGAAGVPTGFASDSSSSKSSSSSSSRSSSSSSSGSSGGSSGSGMSIGGGKMVCQIDQSASAGDQSSLPFKNLTISYYPTLGTIEVIGGSDYQLELIKDYITRNDKKSPQAYLEVQIINLNEEGSKSFTNNWQFFSKNISFNAGGGSVGLIDKHPIFFAGKGYTEPSSSYNPESGGFVDYKDPYGGKWASSPRLVYTLNYLIENKKGRTLANPRILLTSGQKSTIDLSSDYVASVTSQYLDGTGSGSSQVQRNYDIQSDNGIQISITPFISPDGYITLDIEPQFNSEAGKVFVDNQMGGQDLQATLLARRSLSLKGVRIKDGETLIIGGLIQETESKSVQKIPFLGDIPVLGMLFRSTGTDRHKEELVIMLTPQILIDTEDAVAQESDLTL